MENPELRHQTRTIALGFLSLDIVLLAILFAIGKIAGLLEKLVG